MKNAAADDFTSFHSPVGTFDPALIEAIAAWCGALNGSLSLQQALEDLVRSLGAVAGMIVRTPRSDRHPVAIVQHDRQFHTALRPLRRTFADGYFGSAIQSPRSASIWIGSVQANEHSPDCDPALQDWQISRGLGEFVVLVLSGSPTTRDHIELHFARPLSHLIQATLHALMPMMARTWAARHVGLITRTVVNHRIPAPAPQPGPNHVSPLAISNPARLSRAEFRVCLFLSRGLSVAAIAQELSLSDATIRTHLRNIYAKTETASLAELVFLLLRPRSEPSLSEIRCA